LEYNIEPTARQRIAWARTLLVACQYLEKLAMAFLYATWAGQVNVLPPEVVEAEAAFFKMQG